MPTFKSRTRVHRLWLGGLTAAAAALALVAIGLRVAPSLLTPRVLTIETATAQNRDVRLADGSQMSVGAGSVLKIAIDDRLRSVTLERGEAYFTVAKDATRPFQVSVGEAAITAIGTAFNVRRTGFRVVVAVSEGAVNVDAAGLQPKAASGSAGPPEPVGSTRLNAGQRLTLEGASAASAGKTTTIDPIAPHAVADWRQGRLQFSGEPLFIAIEDINRYALHPIVIGDPAIRELRVTGAVSQNNIDGWLKSLEKSLPVSVIRTSTGSVQLVGR